MHNRTSRVSLSLSFTSRLVSVSVHCLSHVSRLVYMHTFILIVTHPSRTVLFRPSSISATPHPTLIRFVLDCCPLGQALKQARVTDTSKVLFIDDNIGNVKAAHCEGWGRCVHFCEAGLLSVEGGKVRTIGDDAPSQHSEGQKEPQNVGEIAVVNDLQQLRSVWPDLFVQGARET